MSDDGAAAAARVRAVAGDRDFAVAIVLGSGLGSLADAVEDAVRIPYADLPGLPAASVSSHRGEVVAGRLEDVPVLVLAGRTHYYEAGDAAAMRPALGMLARLGCGTVILTNAAGSVREDFAPGTVMLVTDHINLAGPNPLVGESGDRRFVGMNAAYDRELRTRFLVAALAEDIALREGVYMWFRGPSFETPAEIRMARTLGADAVGMSTVPEAILARFFGLRVAALATIANYGAGMVETEPSHSDTKEIVGRSADRVERIVRRVLKDWPR